MCDISLLKQNHVNFDVQLIFCTQKTSIARMTGKSASSVVNASAKGNKRVCSNGFRKGEAKITLFA